MEGNHQLAILLYKIASQNADKIAECIDEALKNADNHIVHRRRLNRDNSLDAILWSIMASMFASGLETEEHGERLKRMTTAIGEKLGLKQEKLDDLELLSVLHDIGKIGIDHRILNKPEKISAEEWVLMKRHSEIGYKIAKSSPQFEHISNTILHHHERWDGTGYPKALKGTEIPLESRILAIADAYDAMTNSRIYHGAISCDAALDEINRCAGTQFDPDIAYLFVQLVPSLKCILELSDQMIRPVLPRSFTSRSIPRDSGKRHLYD